MQHEAAFASVSFSRGDMVFCSCLSHVFYLGDAGKAQEEANKDKGSSHKHFLSSEGVNY